ncbi:hypothetical protein [Cryobacterium glucosi]|uniref:hypothetical protein n=1 Tax=Cryobacterium glucosi TaxID=1259175 RepID=UPI00141B19FF|nr:hypothetical protein [Cryobacterium glucosi]
MQVYERVDGAYVWLNSALIKIWQHRPKVDTVKVILDFIRTAVAAFDAVQSMTQPATA